MKINLIFSRFIQRYEKRAGDDDEPRPGRASFSHGTFGSHESQLEEKVAMSEVRFTQLEAAVQ